MMQIKEMIFLTITLALLSYLLLRGKSMRILFPNYCAAMYISFLQAVKSNQGMERNALFCFNRPTALS